jgi:TPR repeat protein
MKAKLAVAKTKHMDEVCTQADYLSDLGHNNLSYELICALAEENHIGALNRLAFLFLSGRGVRKNKNKALFFFERAAHLNSEAMLNLGLFYRDHKKMYSKAMHCFRRLAKDSKSCFAGQAKIEIAEMYIGGLGVKKDNRKAQQILEEVRDTPSLFKSISEKDRGKVTGLLVWIKAIRAMGYK